MLKSILLKFALAITTHALWPILLRAQECQVRVLTRLKDDGGRLWQANTLLPVTIKRMTATGDEYCASGGNCMPDHVQGVSALKLLYCKVGPQMDGSDYRLVPDPLQMGTASAARMTQRLHVENRLVELGFSNAAAASLADTCLAQPHSLTSRRVTEALAGSKRALLELQHSYQ